MLSSTIERPLFRIKRRIRGAPLHNKRASPETLQAVFLAGSIQQAHTPSIHSPSGTCRRSSSSQTAAVASLGARQSPRGESDPPDPTFGPFGIAERLNWLS